MIKFKQFKQSFTLVELIIVIAIIAILSVSAMMILSKRIGTSRNSKRYSDIGKIAKVLDLYQLEHGTYPSVDDSIQILDQSGAIIGYQGIFNGSAMDDGVSISKTPKDPKDNEDYAYIKIVNPAKGYEIGGLLENEYMSYLNDITFAGTIRTPYIIENHNYKSCNSNSILQFPNILTMLNTKEGGFLKNSNMTSDGSYAGVIIDLINLIGTCETTIIAPILSITGTSLIIGSGDLKIAQGEIDDGGGTGVCMQPGRCYYGCNQLENAHADWTDNDLFYDTGTNKCYVFGDEDTNATNACNMWVTDNATQGGTWIWTPARWFVTDGYGTDLKDSFYQREVTYNGNTYVCRGFAIMKYEAKFPVSKVDDIGGTSLHRTIRTCSDYATDNDIFCETVAGGGIVSTANEYPIALLRGGEAIHACGTAGTYHLPTNNEWMALARNLEMQGYNWTSGTVGNGGIYRGNGNLSDSMTYDSQTAYGTRSYPAGNDSEARGVGAVGNRWHQLSNGSKIRDFVGNVREYVNKSNVPGTSNDRVANNGWNSNIFRLSNVCGGLGQYNYSGNVVFSQCIYQNSYTYDNLGPGTPNLGVVNGAGSIGSTNTASCVFRRGNDGANGVENGLYSLITSANAGVTGGHDSGFRCAR